MQHTNELSVSFVFKNFSTTEMLNLLKKPFRAISSESPFTCLHYLRHLFYNIDINTSFFFDAAVNDDL